MRVTRKIDATEQEVAEAKKAAIELVGRNSTLDIVGAFSAGHLADFEKQIKMLNVVSASSWLLSALLLYTVIFDNKLYEESGLDWFHYSRESRERLGLDGREITEQLASARFFIKNHKRMIELGFAPEGNRRKLARAELAESLCDSTDETIQHIVNDSWGDFNKWYKSFKKPTAKKMRSDIVADGGKFSIGDIEAVKISDDISAADKSVLESCMKEIFKMMSEGRKPIVLAETSSGNAKI